MISVDFSALVILALVFALVLVLRRVFFEPLAKAMETRDALIEGAEQLWRDASHAIDEVQATIRSRVQQTRSEGYEKLETTRTEAQEKARDRIEREREKIRREITEARESLRDQGEKAVGDLESQAERLASQIASRILGRQVA